MKTPFAAMRLPLIFVFSLTAAAIAVSAQSACSALNAAQGEGKFTGEISTVPDGTSMTVSYGGQNVLVHYGSTVIICQGGQPASVALLVQGRTVSVFGPERRSGSNVEIDAARIFVAGQPRANAQPELRPNAMPSQSAVSPHTLPPSAQSGVAAPEPDPRFGQTRPTGDHAVPHSVILDGGTQAQTIARLHVMRKYALSDLRSSPQIDMAGARLDFRPVLNNQKALFNVAQRLQAIPQHLQVLEQTSEISEVDQGIVVHSILAYRILPGKCADAAAKTQLEQAGIEYFSRATTSERIAEFSTPGSPRYVSDPQKRQQAVASYQRNIAASQNDAASHIAQLRKALADPAQRAAIAAQIGQAETARMSGLSDDQLQDEVINASTQRFEETMYVPKVESTNYLHPQHNLTSAASPGEIAATQTLLHQGGAGTAQFPKLLKVVPAAQLHTSGEPHTVASDQTADEDLGTFIFLTGFTVGRDYEWKWSAETTVNWCVVGCSSTYGIYLHAGFGYGFGLRFPIQAQLKYQTVVRSNNSATADVTATYVPIKGTVNDFLQSGMPVDQVFNGQELVAQVGADAGYSVNLPGMNPSNDDYLGVDLTNNLPGPYAGGFFTPPAPGVPGLAYPYVADSVDLLMGLLNFGVVGAQLFPAVNIVLFSNDLKFTLNDEIANRSTPVNSTGQKISVNVASRAGGASESHFTFGNPVYNLEFGLTPGLNPRVFIDLGIWSNHWDWQIWFPQLTVDLPPKGIDFGCHAGTTCVLDFQPVFNAATGQVNNIQKEEDTADRILTQGGCQRVNNQEGNYLCPVKGQLGLCQAMQKNGAVLSCTPLVPAIVDKVLKGGKCTGANGAYACPQGMMGLCDQYIKNQEILSCTQTK